jgi:hypothetical protein
VKFHAMIALVVNLWYRCEACGHTADLAGAVKHAVNNQVTVK